MRYHRSWSFRPIHTLSVHHRLSFSLITSQRRFAPNFSFINRIYVFRCAHLKPNSITFIQYIYYTYCIECIMGEGTYITNGKRKQNEVKYHWTEELYIVHKQGDKMKNIGIKTKSHQNEAPILSMLSLFSLVNFRKTRIIPKKKTQFLFLVHIKFIAGTYTIHSQSRSFVCNSIDLLNRHHHHFLGVCFSCVCLVLLYPLCSCLMRPMHMHIF